MEKKIAERIVNWYAIILAVLGIILLGIVLYLYFSIKSQLATVNIVYEPGYSPSWYDSLLGKLFIFIAIIMVIELVAWGIYKKNVYARYFWITILSIISVLSTGIFVYYMSMVIKIYVPLGKEFSLVSLLFLVPIVILSLTIYLFLFNKDIKALFVKSTVVETAPAKKVVIAPKMKQE